MQSWCGSLVRRTDVLEKSSTGRPNTTIEIEQPEWPLGNLLAMGIPNALENTPPKGFWLLGHAYLHTNK
jgi:hypothetical protein